MIESAEYRSQARAALRLRVIDVESEGYERRAARMPIAASGVVRASVCDRIPSGESIAARIVDLSESGAGLLMDDIRPRPGDRMWLAARFIEGELNADMRVAHVRPTGRGGEMNVGCSFIDPGAVAGVVSRIVARLAGAGRAQSRGQHPPRDARDRAPGSLTTSAAVDEHPPRNDQDAGRVRRVRAHVVVLVEPLLLLRAQIAVGGDVGCGVHRRPS